MSHSKLQLGFDIGGTNIAAGLVDEKYAIVSRMTRPFPRGAHTDLASVETIADMANTLCEERGIRLEQLNALGAAVPGSIDAAGETVLDAFNLDYHKVPLKRLLTERLHIDVHLCNDANAATLAELYGGALRGCDTAVLLTLGTGVGGGLVLGGKMFNGGCKQGVEPGHVILHSGGIHCTCGQYGCLERYCAASRLTRDGATLGFADAKMVIDAAKDGDERAEGLFRQYIEDLGDAVVSFVNLLDPQCIAIGGGLSNAGEFLLEPLRENVRKKCFFENCPPIVRATMGNDAGIVGAAMLFANE